MLRCSLRRLGLGMGAALLMPGWLIAATSFAHEHAAGQHSQSQHKAAAATKACEGVELRCAQTATPVFATDGTLWLAWAAGGRVSVARSNDRGASFSQPVLIDATELPLDSGPDARPKIAISPDGRIIVAFASRDEKYNGHVFIAEARDGGQAFAAPHPLAPKSPSQRFETIAFDPSGRLFAAWIDKRNAAAARAAKTPYAGAALAYAWSGQQHAKLGSDTLIGPDAIAKDNTCECCRIGVAFAGPGRPVVLFRNIFEGGVRDHGVITFADPLTPGPVQRVSIDDAVTDSCPHHGPSLSIDKDGTYHVVWMAVGRKLKGAYYARSKDGGATFSTPLPLGTADAQVSRPFVLAGPDGVHVAWKEFNGEVTAVQAMTSADGGQSWSSARTLLATSDTSDHPLLLADGAASYLSWLTSRDGYRVVPLADASVRNASGEQK